MSYVRTALVLLVSLMAADAGAQTTALVFDSQPGDYIGQGLDFTLTAADATITAARGKFDANSIKVAVVMPGDPFPTWRLDFIAAGDVPIVVGTYLTARRYPFTTFNGLDVHGDGRGCNELTGRFVVLDVAYGPAPDFEILRFAADFEQHCEDQAPALFGAIRYNSVVSDLTPFGGLYPRIELSLTRPTHGRVTGVDLDCGPSTTQCVRTLSAAERLQLTAMPDPGYMFAGWTDDCHGGVTISINVNGPKACTPLFEPIVPVTPRTMLQWTLSPREPFVHGKYEVLVPANSTWQTLFNPGFLRMTVLSIGDRAEATYRVSLSPGTGDVLQAGRRYVMTGLNGAPYIAIEGASRGCVGLFGAFTIRQLVVAPGDIVQRLFVEFESNCSPPSPNSLVGSLMFNATAEMPTVTADTSSVNFGATTAFGAIVSGTNPQSVRLMQAGAGTTSWQVVANVPWLSVSPASGSGPGAFTISLAPVPATFFGSGTLVGTVTVTPTGSSVATIPILVTLRLYPQGTTAAPIGAVDTPFDNIAGVTGAIPITGWALDDVDLTDVQICRVPTASEGTAHACAGTQMITVGTGTFVEGARPDVQQAFPTHPGASRAGWGFMLLTNMLPNQGNGAFTFYIYARDGEGHSTLLGQRTINCINAQATRPFGAIDTPAQGGTARGSGYVNFGWALVPRPRFIPTDGSTIDVVVDGVPVGNVTYNNFRADIASLFPSTGYINSPGAVGFRILDTTTLADGLHTISWIVRDSLGATEGIGSRFFWVSNNALSSPASASAETRLAVRAAASAATTIVGRRGWDLDARWTSYTASGSGRVLIRGEEVDRFELALGADAGDTYSGYLRVGDELTPLPAGSRLDADTGRFTWAPGVGFVGTYDLVLVRSRGGQVVARSDVRFVLHAKGRGLVGPQVVIDVPHAEQHVAQPLMLGGWAADRDAQAGTGVSGVHVWAYPVAGGPPIFLGPATYGGIRPDVAAVHGDRFRESGFGLVLQGLAPGTYDLAVYAWSTERGDFVPAKVVRVTAR
jgi:hypothetical protein